MQEEAPKIKALCWHGWIYTIFNRCNHFFIKLIDSSYKALTDVYLEMAKTANY